MTRSENFPDGTSRVIANEENSAVEAHIYRHLMGRFDMSCIEAAIRWLWLGNYISEGQMGLRSAKWFTLIEKGLAAADANAIPLDDKELLYQDQDPYAVFIAHQFNEDDADLVKYIRERVLEPNGFTVLEGRADGLEAFRTSIVTKIKRARFFLCLLTRRAELASGNYASSVWLYQESGVAVAFDKQPLLLVEQGIDSGFVGELQAVYEYIRFTRSNHSTKFDEISRRFLVDLQAHNIPAPAPGN